MDGNGKLARLRARPRTVLASKSTDELSRALDIILDPSVTNAQMESALATAKQAGDSRLEIRRTKSDQVYSMLYSGLRTWYMSNSEKIPTYEDPSRDLFISELWRKEPILAGAVYSMTAKMSAMRWFVTGKRLKARNFARILAEAAHFDGYSWDGFISSTAEDFYTTNRGTFWETNRVGDRMFGKLASVGHMDALCCTLTGNKEYPMVYSSDVTGQTERFRTGEYIHFASLPSPRERHLGIGFCAVDRAFRAIKLLMACHDYDDQKLSNLPPEGVAAVSGMTMEEFMDALRLWQAQRKADNSLTFPQVLWLIGSQPGAQVSVDIQGFSSLPESFNRDEVVTHYVNTLAMCFGVDAREFWPISSGALGTASESEIQHLKAKGKGPGEFISVVERHLNGEVDEDTQFGFDTQDIEEDMNAAVGAKAWVDVFYPLYTGTPAGKSKASPDGKANTDMVPDEEEIPKDSAANVRRNQVGALQAPGGFGASQGPEQIITKDQILRLLADKGVIPEWMMNDQRMRVEDTSIHISKQLDDNEYTQFVFEHGVLKEQRLPPIILESSMKKEPVEALPYAQTIKGGKGSGFHGHAGRPGEVGGSQHGGSIGANIADRLSKFDYTAYSATANKSSYLNEAVKGVIEELGLDTGFELLSNQAFNAYVDKAARSIGANPNSIRASYSPKNNLIKVRDVPITDANTFRLAMLAWLHEIGHAYDDSHKRIELAKNMDEYNNSASEDYANKFASGMDMVRKAVVKRKKLGNATAELSKLEGGLLARRTDYVNFLEEILG